MGSGNIGRVVRVLTYFIGLLPPAKIIIFPDPTSTPKTRKTAASVE